MANGTPLMLPALDRAASKSAGRYAKPTAEHAAHVRLVIESSFLGDFGDGTVRVLKLLHRMGNTQIGDVIANGFPEVAAERYCHGHWVNTSCRCDLRQPDPAQIAGPYQLYCIRQPIGHFRFGQGAMPADACSEQVDQSFDCNT